MSGLLMSCRHHQGDDHMLVRIVIAHCDTRANLEIDFRLAGGSRVHRGGRHQRQSSDTVGRAFDPDIADAVAGESNDALGSSGNELGTIADLADREPDELGQDSITDTLDNGRARAGPESNS